MTHKLDSRAARRRLKERREPYWQNLLPGRALGYRKGATGGHWVARYTPPGSQRKYQALGPADDVENLAGALTFEAAVRTASEWFRSLSRGARTDYTVNDAVKAYLKHLRTSRSGTTANDAEKRAKRYIIDTALGKAKVSALTTQRLKDWRDGLLGEAADGKDPETLRRKKDTANRIWTILRAALTLAWRDGHVADDNAWRRIKPYPGASARREVFLSEAQCRELLEKCDDDFAALVRAGLYTGARLGELLAATVGSFDKRTGTLQIPRGKTGARPVVLPDEAVAWFGTLTAKRPQTEPLFMRQAKCAEWNKMEVSRCMRRAAKAAELPEGTCFYTLRHTYVSTALVRGVNIQLIAENVGTSVRMIEQHYGKFMHADRRKAFNAAALNLDTAGAALLQ